LPAGAARAASGASTHQPFCRREALRAIGAATIGNITAFEERRRSGNEL
jgi:hypothetical protein